jgi:hypothetical protein
MSWFANLRILAFVRRGVRALESISDSQRTLAKLAEDAWEEKHAPHLSKKMEFGTLNVEEVNTRYHNEQKAKMLTHDEEDER